MAMAVKAPVAVVMKLSVEGSRRRRIQPQQQGHWSGIVGDKRLSLLVALSLQAATRSQQGVQNLIVETLKYLNPSRVSQPRNLEEALMTAPDLETIPYRLVRKEKDYEVRQVESYIVAETSVPSRRGFDVLGSSQAFNTLAAYLFGKNTTRQEMEMTTPVTVRKAEKMEMTTPVLAKAEDEGGSWRMAFVMPSKYNEETLPAPQDPSVKIRRVPPTLLAVVAFSGYVTDEEARRREQQLRRSLEKDPTLRVKPFARGEVAQYNPPFTPPFLRRNELALEVEYVKATQA